MTEEQKDILIAKMLDAPTSLTNKELDMILHNEDLKDIYETSVIVSDACNTQKEFDAEQEWRLFRQRILPKTSISRRFMRIAAVFLGVIVVAGLGGKLIDYSLTKGYKEQVAENVKSSTPKTQQLKEETQQNSCVIPAPSPEQNAKETSAPMTISRDKGSHAPKNEETEEIDVDEYLRQQQDEIEDAIIRQNAEIYVDEYYAMKEFFCGMNDENRIITE